MDDPKIDQALERNQRLATALGINGTPAYLIGERFIPGAIDSASLAKVISEERAKLISAALAEKNRKIGARTTPPLNSESRRIRLTAV